MKEIKLKGIEKVTLVDDDDYLRFAGLSWYLSSTGYAQICVSKFKQREGFPQNLALHRLVMACPPDKMIDHINGDPLDNRKENLRFCDHAENMQNSDKNDERRVSKYKGVCYRVAKDRTRRQRHWFAKIQHKGKSKYLGSFYTEEEAHEAYVKASIELHGEYSFFRRDRSHK